MARAMSGTRRRTGWPGRLAALGLAGCLLFVQAAQAAESVTYFHFDALGSPVAATDEAGNVLWREAYRPYGERLRAEAGDDQDLWYTGKPEEGEFGLQYFGARWYDPATGRFQGLDPAGVDPAHNIHTFNRYAYAGANPYKYTDPDGELLFLVPAVIWAAGAGVTAYDTYQTYKTEGAGAATASLATGAVITAATGGAGSLAVKLYKARRAGKAAQRASNASKGENKGTASGPNFIVSRGGTAFPVPKGATGPTPVVNPAGKQTGSAFTGGKGGANGQVDTMRLMDPTPSRGKSPGYPSGYIKYENKAGQGVDPYTGGTVSNSQSHYPID